MRKALILASESGYVSLLLTEPIAPPNQEQVGWRHDDGGGQAEGTGSRALSALVQKGLQVVM